MTQSIVAKTKVPINIIAQDELGNPYSLQGATVTLEWLYPNNTTLGGPVSMTVQSTAYTDSSGVQQAAAYQWAQYVCSTADFPIDGTYNAQVNILTSSTQTPATIPFTIKAYPKIGS